MPRCLFISLGLISCLGQWCAAEALRATITGIEGMVQVRQDAESPWAKAELGVVVGEKGEFRTGPKSAVRLVLPGGHTITLDRLGIVKLLQAVNEGGKTKTKVGMKYGRTRYDIQTAGAEHESSIVSPNATLAIRGTEVSLYDQRPFLPEATRLSGRAEFRDFKKQVAFGGKGAGKSKVNTAQPTAAAVRLNDSVVDPTVAKARTDGEAGLIDTLLSRGATVSFDRQSGIKVVTGGMPPTDRQLNSVLPGVLTFVVRWGGNSNIDMGVSSPGGKNGGGEFLYPATGLNTSPNGGRIPFDHRGGNHGGFEIAFWSGSFPTGLYGIGLILASGEPTVASVQAFKNGRSIKIFDGESLVNRVVVPVFPPTPGIGEGTLGGIVPVGTELPQAGRSSRSGALRRNDLLGTGRGDTRSTSVDSGRKK
jgi:FecR protein